MGEFTREDGHWLRRFSPDEWIAAALGELSRADKSWARGDARAGAVGVKRAAGMALNAALIVEPDGAWGRTYLEHVEALARDARVPEAVRAASRAVSQAKAPEGDLVSLRTPRAHLPVIEAARDVIAHAWVVVKRHEKPPGREEPAGREPAGREPAGRDETPERDEQGGRDERPRHEELPKDEPNDDSSDA